MEINNDLIDKLAELARLEFNTEEKASIKSDLEKMILFVNKLNELDTSGVEPLLHITQQAHVLRPDEVNGMCSRPSALQNAQVKDDQFFKVPKVISKT